MKLPYLELKKIEQIKNNKHKIYLRPKNILNNLPNNSISSVLYNNSIKTQTITQTYNKSQRRIKKISQKKEKVDDKINLKKFFLNHDISLIQHNDNSNNNKSNYNNSNNNSNNKSSYANENSGRNYEYINGNKYIKNPFNSFKIRKEISSFIYSSPENQIKFINYIMNKSDNNTINNMDNNKSNILFPITKKKKKIKESYDEKEKDEDKINIKDVSLFTLFFGKSNKGNKCEKTPISNMKKNINSSESWDNKLLKKILPKNIKNYYEYKYQNEVNYCRNSKLKKIKKASYFRNNAYKTLKSMSNKRGKTNYNFNEKFRKINMLFLNKGKQKDNNIAIKSMRKLSRSSSIC